MRILATGVLLLEKVSELLGQPLQIGKGGLREGVVLDMLNGSINGSPVRLARLVARGRARLASDAWHARARSSSIARRRSALAAARVVEVRAEEVFEHSDGVLDLDDVERVHDMRVATRRLRAALEIFEACFPRKRHRKALKRVKALADALGERRDLDVEIELLEGLAGRGRRRGSRGARGADRGAAPASSGGPTTSSAPFVAAKRLKKLRRRLAKLVKEVER